VKGVLLGVCSGAADGKGYCAHAERSMLSEAKRLEVLADEEPKK